MCKDVAHKPEEKRHIKITVQALNIEHHQSDES